MKSISQALATVAGRAFDILLPPACISCGFAVDIDRPPVCAGCWRKLPRIHPPWCPTCGCTRTTPSGVARSPGCGECLDWSGLRSAAPYRMDGMAVRLVHGLKYGGWRRLAPEMAGSMVAAARRLTRESPHRLVPVPLSRARERERGLNQAELLARGLADQTGWPLVTLLRRIRAGEQQARLGRRRRAANVRGLFEVDDDGRESTPGPILLVDDVVTTGATAAACAAALTASGLECSGVVSFARAARPIDAHR